MNREGYREVSAAVSTLGLGYEVMREPEEGQDVLSFDVTSEGGAILPSTVINALHDAAENRLLSVMPRLVTAQPHCLTFEDTTVG